MRTNAAVFVLLLVATVAAQDSGSSQKSQSSASPANPTLSLNQAVITNQDVTGMLKAGISPEIVAAKIRNSKCQCDTSPAALGELKSAGVPDNVILAMVESMPPPPSGLDDIRQAKSVYLVDRGTDTAVFEHLSERLQKWGRWTIVAHPEQADLLLVFASNQAYFGSMSTASVTSSGTYSSGTGMSFPLMSLPRFLIAIDRVSGRQLMAISCERRGSASYTSGVLVNRLRKQVEKLQNPQAP
jgi:hypothetical protein